ncbi:restriction endonuclease subunit S, partial [Streptococcus mutans]
MKFEELSQVSSYVSERIEINNLSLENYISTENMISERRGVVEASKLPTGKTTIAFKKGDILISNIRPYFKKIWLADKSGGCSNDVLVIRANEKISNRFLYYVLSSNNFFAYAVGTSKGTKMPRGDKKAIMKYSVPLFSFEEQEKIANILSSYDKKIFLNKQINHHLEQMA